MTRLFALGRLFQFGVVAILAGAIVWLVDLGRERRQLQAELAASKLQLRQAEAALAQQHRIQRLLQFHLTCEAASGRRWSELSEELQSMEGQDAPLSPLLSATAERLYGPH